MAGKRSKGVTGGNHLNGVLIDIRSYTDLWIQHDVLTDAYYVCAWCMFDVIIKAG